MGDISGEQDQNMDHVKGGQTSNQGSRDRTNNLATCENMVFRSKFSGTGRENKILLGKETKATRGNFKKELEA